MLRIAGVGFGALGGVGEVEPWYEGTRERTARTASAWLTPAGRWGDRDLRGFRIRIAQIPTFQLYSEPPGGFSREKPGRFGADVARQVIDSRNRDSSSLIGGTRPAQPIREPRQRPTKTSFLVGRNTPSDAWCVAPGGRAKRRIEIHRAQRGAPYKTRRIGSRTNSTTRSHCRQAAYFSRIALGIASQAKRASSVAGPCFSSQRLISSPTRRP